MKVRFLDVAQRELDEAVDYYNAEVSGLGDAFLMEVLSAIDRIRSFPAAWHPLGSEIRRCRLRRFSYGLIYAVEDEAILVIAVANLHRRPDFWHNRLRGA